MTPENKGLERKQMAYLKEAWEALENGYDVFLKESQVLLTEENRTCKIMVRTYGSDVPVSEDLLGDNFTIKLKKPVFTDFGNCFDWINAYAMDKDGRWWGYEAAPRVARWDNWEALSGCVIKMPGEYAPKFDGDWKDSLCVREENNTCKTCNGTGAVEENE